MTESQLRQFPAFRGLPVYEESDPKADSLTTVRGAGSYRAVRECTTIQEVLDALQDARLVPLGALRAGAPGQQVVVAYFGESA